MALLSSDSLPVNQCIIQIFFFVDLCILKISITVAAALTLDNTSYDVKAVQEELVNQGALI